MEDKVNIEQLQEGWCLVFTLRLYIYVENSLGKHKFRVHEVVIYSCDKYDYKAIQNNNLKIHNINIHE